MEHLLQKHICKPLVILAKITSVMLGERFSQTVLSLLLSVRHKLTFKLEVQQLAQGYAGSQVVECLKTVELD